jgi:predicted dinucleotide-binding enzyme
MKIAVLGTGTVGRALARRLSGLGHDVVIGTRSVEQTRARTEPDAWARHLTRTGRRRILMSVS